MPPQDLFQGGQGTCAGGPLPLLNQNSPRQQFGDYHARGLEPFGRGGRGHFRPSHPRIMSPNTNWGSNRQMAPNVATRPKFWFCQDCNNQNYMSVQECPRCLERYRSNVRAARRY